MDDRATEEVRSAGDLDPAVGAAREVLHRSNALSVRLAVDRGDGEPAALVACERFSPVAVVLADRTLLVAHDAPVQPPEGMPEIPSLPPLQVDPAEGRVATPMGALHALADALAEVAALVGGRSVAAAILETDHEDAPLGIASRSGEPSVITLGDARYELPG